MVRRRTATLAVTVAAVAAANLLVTRGRIRSGAVCSGLIRCLRPTLRHVNSSVGVSLLVRRLGARSGQLDLLNRNCWWPHRGKSPRIIFQRLDDHLDVEL